MNCQPDLCCETQHLFEPVTKYDHVESCFISSIEVFNWNIINYKSIYYYKTITIKAYKYE